MTEEDNLDKIQSMRGIVGKVAQQTIECARFIREYSGTKSFCESSGHCISHVYLILTMIIGGRVGKNIVAETDELMQEFRDRTGRDVAIFVHSIGKDSDAPLRLDALIPLKVKHSISAARFMRGAQD
jgi:hypothetical protein